MKSRNLKNYHVYQKTNKNLPSIQTWGSLWNNEKKSKSEKEVGFPIRLGNVRLETQKQLYIILNAANAEII